MRSLALIVSLLSVGILPSFALDKAAILKLAKKPHDRENLRPELKLFGNIRKFESDLTMHPKDRDPMVLDTFTGTEKTVEGKYIVSEFTPPGAPGKMVMVVTFDQKEETYLKWILFPQGDVAKMTGVSAKGSRAISWVSETEGGVITVILEQHTDQGATWTEMHYTGGKLLGTTTGVARKTK